MLPIIVMISVFILIAIRRIGKTHLALWQIMLAGACFLVITLQISPREALIAINVDVILYLFGMFVVGEGLRQSGYLAHISHRLFRKSSSVDHLILSILFGIGFCSMFLPNDALALIGTAIMLNLSLKHDLPPRFLLLTLAFAVTTGSVMSPMGNPQNLLIALEGKIDNPFVTYFRYLVLPTILNLFITYLFLKLFFREHFHRPLRPLAEISLHDRHLALLSVLSLFVMIGLIGFKILMVFFGPIIELRLTYIALMGSVPILCFSPKREAIVKNVDYHTLIFFGSMFVVMHSVVESRVFLELIGGLVIDSIPEILFLSAVISQFTSNVPLVLLFLPLLVENGVSVQGMMSLAAGSTIAGNITILGAASNVIIIQNAERMSGETLKFSEFAKVGIPLTAIQLTVYWIFLALL